ncbi:hypothetical protein [Streptomyces luteogriseus]|uniref:hypothetical protein n=1 Tax=Streptomyces luteogriseus TaxID=68233 RepID=UPI00261E5024|nr:hypothetical protein [uncultured Streptomyces sp.]
MTTQVLDEPGTVVLDANGYGLITFQPESFRTWNVTSINVRTDQGPAETPVPQCTVYLGVVDPGAIKAQTYMGNRSTAQGSIIVQPSTQLLVEWTNGIPGSTATVSLYGQMSMR